MAIATSSGIRWTFVRNPVWCQPGGVSLCLRPDATPVFAIAGSGAPCVLCGSPLPAHDEVSRRWSRSRLNGKSCGVKLSLTTAAKSPQPRRARLSSRSSAPS